jgi:hypothetical protein
LARALGQRPTSEFQLDVPGHTQKGRPASAKGRTTPEKPRSTSSVMPKRAAIVRTTSGNEVGSCGAS